jgi:hypothetical protein
MRDKFRTWGFPLVLLAVTGFFLFLFIQNYRSTHCGSDVLGMEKRSDETWRVLNPCADDPLAATYSVDSNGVTRSNQP